MALQCVVESIVNCIAQNAMWYALVVFLSWLAKCLLDHLVMLPDIGAQ